jgi:hypothetical protein
MMPPSEEGESGSKAARAAVPARIASAIQWLGSRKDAIAAIKDIFTIVALVVAGAWTILLTRQFRDTAPKLSTTHQVQSWRLPDKKLLVRVQAKVINSGKVLIYPVEGVLLVQQFLPLTGEQRKWLEQGRLIHDCVDDSGKRMEGCVPQQGLRFPGSKQVRFELSGIERSLEPGEENSYWRYLTLDEDARIVEVYTFFGSAAEKGRRGWSADSVLALKPDE